MIYRSAYHSEHVEQPKYACLILYVHPMLALKSMRPGPNATVDINVFSQEVYTGMVIAVVVFFLGYLVVAKKSVK